jgi:hypothetical protein
MIKGIEKYAATSLKFTALVMLNKTSKIGISLRMTVALWK